MNVTPVATGAGAGVAVGVGVAVEVGVGVGVAVGVGVGVAVGVGDGVALGVGVVLCLLSCVGVAAALGLLSSFSAPGWMTWWG